MANVKTLSANNVDYVIKDEVARLALESLPPKVLEHYSTGDPVNIEDTLATKDETQFYQFLFSGNCTGELVTSSGSRLWSIVNIPSNSNGAGCTQLAFCMDNTTVWYRRKTWWNSGGTPIVWSGWRPVNIELYSTNETHTGKYWIDGKPIYRKVINFGTLPNKTFKQVGHNIANLSEFTEVRAIANNGNGTFLPIPYVPTATNNEDKIALWVNSVNVRITSNEYDFTAYPNCYVILEYTKTS